MYQRAWRRFVPRKLEENTKENWDRAYLSGYWDRLHSISEVPHAAVIAGYFHAVRGVSDMNILDVGCGEGLLLDVLKIGKEHRYLGIDISQIAIERATPKMSENIHFEVMNIEGASLKEEYSIIVLNECVCYFQDLVSVMRMLLASLRENGYIIVSLYLSPQTKKMWRTLEVEMKMIDMVEMKSVSGSRWRVGLFESKLGSAY